MKWQLRYLKGSEKVGLIYKTTNEGGNDIKGYCDADYAIDLDKRIKILNWLCFFCWGQCGELEVYSATHYDILYDRS